MADNPQTLALIVLAQQYGGDIVRQINRTSTALRVLPIVVGEGKNVAWVAEGDGQLAEPYADGADATNFGADAQLSATLNWALYRSPIRVTGLARAASRTSQTPQGNIQLWARNLVNSSAKLASQINAHVYSGNGAATPKEVTGLNSAIGDDSNTYAGLARGSYDYWKPTVVDPGSLTALSFSQIRDDLKEIYIDSGENPDIALCHPAVFNEAVKLFDSNRRYCQPVDKVRTARGEVKLDAGYMGVEVDGCVFLKDKDATANRIYYINTNHLELQVLPQADQPEIMPGTMLSANDGFGAIPLLFQYEMLATLGDSRRAQIKAYVELACKKPRCCGVRKNVAVAI
jgi:hypothetical protein